MKAMFQGGKIMNEDKFDEMIDELIDSCFEIHSGNYDSDRCLELDDVVEVLEKYISIKPTKRRK